MTARRWIAGLLAAAVAAVAILGLTGVGMARTTKPKIVKVCDNYFTPTSVKVRKRGKVKWKWGCGFARHNVTLARAPKGVRKSRFRSRTTASPTYRFTKRFKRPGKYHFVCGIHESLGMRMNVVVRRHR
jgi:plastocyanin